MNADEDATSLPVKPYRNAFDHLLDEVARIDLIVRAAVEQMRAATGDAPFRGLSISEADVDALLERQPGQPPWATAPASAETTAAFEATEQFVHTIALRCAASVSEDVALRIVSLIERFDLDRFDLDVVLLALAPQLDIKYERLYAYLNDDVTRKRPTVAMAIGLLCPDALDVRLGARERFGSNAPLIRHNIVHVVSDGPGASRLGGVLCLDERIAGFLLGEDDLDPRLARFARLFAGGEVAAPASLSPLEAQLVQFLSKSVQEDERGPVVYLVGPYGVGKRATVEAIIGEFAAPLLVVNCEKLAAMPDDEVIRTKLKLVVREAMLQDAVILWDGGGILLDGARPNVRAVFLETLNTTTGPAFITGEMPWEPGGALHRRPFVRVELVRPNATEQAAIWQSELDRHETNDVNAVELTSAFKLTGGQIRDAVASAHSLARLRDADGPICQADLRAACLKQTQSKLGDLARKTTSAHTWDELVLPADRKEHLREICMRARHRARVFDHWGMGLRFSQNKGISALFSGPPGTGKTMAAGVIARELDLELFQIDLSAVVSKYIGETEKQLSRVFTAAEASNAVLFFDEGDALFGKRTEVKDSHDRYANQEVSYLLQRIESYEGIVILTSNLTKNMDEAFVRRLGFIVEFPFPGVSERLRIWKGMFPAQMPLDEEINFSLLAQRLELSGGHIRNIALSASFLAAEDGAVLGMRHIMRAARREYQKTGKVVDETRFALGERRA